MFLIAKDHVACHIPIDASLISKSPSSSGRVLSSPAHPSMHHLLSWFLKRIVAIGYSVTTVVVLKMRWRTIFQCRLSMMSSKAWRVLAYLRLLNIRNVFFHVPIEEGSRKYTSFLTHQGQYKLSDRIYKVHCCSVHEPCLWWFGGHLYWRSYCSLKGCRSGQNKDRGSTSRLNLVLPDQSFGCRVI